MQNIEIVYTNGGPNSVVKKKDIPAVVQTLREVKRRNRGRLTAKLAFESAKKDRSGVLGKYIFNNVCSNRRCREVVHPAGG